MAPSKRAPRPASKRPARAAADPSSDTVELSAARVLRQFRVVFNAVKTHFQQVERRVGLGGAQIWALSVIRANPGIGVNDLSLAMDIHQTTASNLVKALVVAGLVAAEKNGPDRRAVHLRILPAGTQVLRKTPGPFAGVLPEALGQLDADTLNRLEQDLALLITMLHADERAAGIPLAQM
ncbi:MarR family winged helix-turn-helix transcriptional regulator [Ideonella sp. A 288]|uniref:MarR family winged helix-turn-helix transcriptional regulator n=1 Tax=Ideonella sp. A 288 TaxID=1962181 RepID=UPI000B4ACA62|nr:MarR family winged helix-turn-helix transcriptional regulator [Ideonella sp. A 288]